MGCKETGHSHAWPTDGVLVIQRCEIRCNFCTGHKAIKEWKYAWFLRRHVRAIHCKGGKGEKYDLEVSTQWKAKSDQDKINKKAAKKPKPKKIKVKDEDDEEEDLGDEEEAEDEVATEGAISKGKSPSTPWVQQPIYRDLPNQFPGMPGGFQHVNPRDIHFDQALAFGDQDVDTLIDHKKVDSLLNDEHILAFLTAHSRKAPTTNSRGAAPAIKAELDEEDDAMKRESGEEVVNLDDQLDPALRAQDTYDSEIALQQSADFYGLDENGDSIYQDGFGIGRDLTCDDRYYMSDYTEPSDTESFWSSDIPLAQMSSLANTHNVAKPVVSEEVIHAMGSLEAVTEELRKEGISTPEMSFAFNSYARVLELHEDSSAQQLHTNRSADEHMELD
ncbi:hypothetical protein Slin15195_G004460 [Septoria linicola]|uniref:Uncharacterized protein n=1 Tax=Septoria linicola TaxID=215465 RepID=A0A9Q9AJA3_9PEZI|nr:hypothetical protein Slin14017_G004500 [Septoria linicola]USW47127.1 hypothetical protein Slin15195_G004460 [Septoria linicola]